MGDKLPKGTLERTNRNDIKDIILSGHKENFRVLVHDTLEKNEDINDTVKEIKQIDLGIQKQHFKALLNIAFEKAENSNTYAQDVIPVLVNTGVIEKNYFQDFDKDSFDKKYGENQKLYENIFKNLGSAILSYCDTHFLDTPFLKDIYTFSQYQIDKELFSSNIENIIYHPKGLSFGYFQQAIINEKAVPAKFPITKDNFLKDMNENDVLLHFKKDHGFKQKGIVPWSKAWFLENPKRKEYLDPQYIKTFKKFGTIIALGIIEGSQNAQTLKEFYEHIFTQIQLKSSRSSVLQLGEVFNLVLKDKNYKIFDKLSEGENIGQQFQEFIEQNSISEKGRTIITLLIVREINKKKEVTVKLYSLKQKLHV